MRVEAIYENGVIKPLIPLKLKNKQLHIEIIIPDEQLEHSLSESDSLRQKIDNILGEYAHPDSAVSPAEDKSIWHRHLEEKYR